MVIGRANNRGIEVEVVSFSIPDASPVNSRDTRPTEAMDAEAPQRTVVQGDVPATDEVKRLSSYIIATIH